MSHSDAIKKLPQGFESIASSNNCESAKSKIQIKNIWGTISP